PPPRPHPSPYTTLFRSVDAGVLPDGRHPIHAGLEHVQRLGPPEAGLALLRRVVEQAGGDRLARRGSSHEHDSPLVTRDEGAAGGGRADGEGEEAITEGGVAR